MPDIPALHKQGCARFVADQDMWWGRYTNCQAFAKQSNVSAKCFHGQVETDGVSVSVLVFRPNPPSPSSPPPQTPASAQKRKRKRQQQDAADQDLHWVKGLPNHSIDQAQRIVGLDPGRKALFTAAVHSQAAKHNLQTDRPNKRPHEILSCSCNRWQEMSGIKYRLAKTDKWLRSDEALDIALVTRRLPKSPLQQHSCGTSSIGCSICQLLFSTLETCATRSCAGVLTSSASRHTQSSAKKSAEMTAAQLLHTVPQASAAAAARAFPARQLCLCGAK